MKLSVSAFRGQTSGQKKILPSYQSQLNYGACNSFTALEGYKFGEDFQMMVDNTRTKPTSESKPKNEGPERSVISTANLEDSEGSRMAEEKEKEKAEKPNNNVSNDGKKEEIPSLEKSPGRNRSKSNQRWMKLRTTVQLSGAISNTNQKSKPPLKREDSFLKRFSTRQMPETQETVDTGDETETLDGPQTQTEVNRRRRKRRKEMSKTVVNPDENFYFYWLMAVTVCVLYNLWTLIVRQSFPELQKDASLYWYWCDGLTDAVFICDIAVQFRTGYLEQGLMVYNSKKLATHYLKSRAFILDILSLLPLEFLQLKIGVNPILRFPRFLKVYRVYNYYYMVESRTVYPNLWRVVNLIHILLILAHWFGCFYYLLSEAEGFQGDWVYPYRPGVYASLTRKYLGSLYWSTLTLTTIGDLPTPETNAEGHSKAMTTSEQSAGIPRRGHKSRLLQFNSNYGYLFTIISYLIGVFIFATIVGQVGNVITNRNANRLEFERLLDGAKTYMRHHKVPGGMKRRVLRWYDYSWSRGRIQGGGDINTALGLLPDKLKTELALHVNLSVLKKVTIFQECQPEFLHDLVLKMKAYIFTPGDLICRKGEVAREMFIIADGILDVISETGRVLTTMKAGDFFGEIGILNLDGLNKRTADVRSVGYSELFSLSREDVLTAMKDYPEAQEILQSLGRKRLMEARNASKSHKSQVKQANDYDSSGDSDFAGKRIVEKLRSDVKGLKNALSRSRRSTRTKETFDRVEENSDRKISNKNPSILRRMSHVQSSDEYEVINDEDQSPPIGVGLPLFQRLKLLKEKQEKERNKAVICRVSKIKKNDSDADTIEPSLFFTQRLKPLKQKEAKESLVQGLPTVSSTVRTQVTGVRFKKSMSKTKINSSIKETEKETQETKTENEIKASNGKKKEASESGIFSFKEKIKFAHAHQEKEKNLLTKILQEKDTSPVSDFKFETSVTVPLVREAENSLGNKFERPNSKDSWKLLKKSSILCSNPEKKLSNEENKLIIKVAKNSAYFSKSDTILEKRNTEELDEEKRFRFITLSNSSKSQKKTLKQTVENLMKERKSSRYAAHSQKIEEGEEKSNNWSSFSCTSKKTPRLINPEGERNPDINMQKMMKMKKYNSISDLSPEYSGLPFVKKLKILNERQKLEELEKELHVRSASLDVPERSSPVRGNVLVRSHSEASAIDFKNISSVKLQADMIRKRKKDKAKALVAPYDDTDRPRLGQCSEFRKINDDPKRSESLIHSEGSVASLESNETIERRHLKSILKKLSAEDSTSDEDFTRELIQKKSGDIDLKKLMRAPTIEGYAARHKKFAKSVTFDNDTLPSSPDSVLDQPVDQSREREISPMTPTALLTLQLSNLSMIPIASPKKTNGNEDRRQSKGEESHSLKKLDKEKENPLSPYVLQELIEKNFQTLPFIRSLGNESSAEIKAEVLQLLQQVLRESQEKMKVEFSSLQSEVQKRDEVIVQLQSKIRELEVKSSQHEGIKYRNEVLERKTGSSGTDPDFSDVPFPQGGSFKTSSETHSPSTETFGALMSPRGSRGSPSRVRNSPDTREDYCMTRPQSTNFLLNLDQNLNNVINYDDELEAKIKNSHFSLHTSHSERSILEQSLKVLPDPPFNKEKELLELTRLCSAEFRNEKQKLKTNFGVDGSSINGTPNRTRHECKPGKKPKGSVLNQITDVQRSFSYSLDKTSDFVALNIDESSNSSDVEDLHHKDWEIQMLVKELQKKDPTWKTEEERWRSETTTDVEHLKDVRQLQKEVNTLKQVVCESNLSRLTRSELDILETIIEAKDQKISQLVKSNSLDDDENTKRPKRPTFVSLSSSIKLKTNARKKPWLRQKIGQALSFDFHDIENRTPKSADSTSHRGFHLRKQKTVSGLRKERKSLYNLWHTSSRLRHRVFEDSDRVGMIKRMTIGRSSSVTSRSNTSSLPILLSASAPCEKTFDMRMSLPLLTGKELRENFRENLPSSFSSSEEGHQEKDINQSRDSIFAELKLSQKFCQKYTRDVNSSLTSGPIKSNECHPSNSFNSFIRSVGQKMRQVMVGDAKTIKNQVPTISKLCDSQPILKETGLEVSDNFNRENELVSKEGDKIPESDFSKIFESDHDHDPKTDPPDL